MFVPFLGILVNPETMVNSQSTGRTHDRQQPCKSTDLFIKKNKIIYKICYAFVKPLKDFERFKSMPDGAGPLVVAIRRDDLLFPPFSGENDRNEEEPLHFSRNSHNFSNIVHPLSSIGVKFLPFTKNLLSSKFLLQDVFFLQPPNSLHTHIPIEKTFHRIL
jgi:hypothetical protein